ncbi:MAG: oxaloacetate decarboxylase [Candidatus Heimdallarchaeota archaeon]
MRKTSILRKLLEQGKIIVAPGAHNAITAKIVETTGFDVVYMPGGGTATAFLGMPDTGLITMNEMVTMAKHIADAVNIPVIADADTGYGNAINVMRTVKEYIQAGIAAIHVEDQISPKRCGHTRGKLLITTEEMIGKLRAADKVRKEIDPDFVLIARCDARTAVGGGIEDLIKRGNAYAKAGADIVFPESPLSVEELELLGKKIEAPLFANMIIKGGLTPLVPFDYLQEMGYAIIIIPLATLQLVIKLVTDFMRALKERGIEGLREFEDRMVTTAEAFTLAGFQEYQKLEEKYLPKEILKARYKLETPGII